VTNMSFVGEPETGGICQKKSPSIFIEGLLINVVDFIC